jgi:hypothetical protein
LILLAVYGLISLASYLIHKKQHLAMIGLVLVILVAQLQVIQDMSDLHPYEYMYFSPLIGGVPGANGQYEMDYYGVCNKPAAQWLAHHYTQYTTQRSPTITASFNNQLVTRYLPSVFKTNKKHPDFYISITRFGLEKRFPSYKIIHTEGIEGYIACVVEVKPSLGIRRFS